VKVKQKNHRHIGMAPNLMPCGPSNTVLLAVVMHFLYHSILPRCFADAAVILNYRDNHTYSQNLLCQQTPYWTKVNRTWFWPRMRPKWTEPQTCLACQNHALTI